MKLGQAMYEQSQAQAQQTGGEAGAEAEAGAEQPGQEEVVDAEFSEVDEGENKG
jgi:molecular chaperone DnaK